MPDEMTIAAYRAACAAAIAHEEAAARAELDSADEAVRACIAGKADETTFSASVERYIVALIRLETAAELITDDYRMLYGTNVFPEGADDA